MRVVYALITVFLALCVVFTRWYFCDIRGLCQYGDDQMVVAKMVSIVEILLMLLVAFLIGFAVSWLLREDTFKSIRGYLTTAQKEKAEVRQQLGVLEKENQSVRKYLVESQETITTLGIKRETAETAYLESVEKLAAAREEALQYQRRFENLKRESDSAKETTAKLKDEIIVDRMMRNHAAAEQKQTENKGEMPVRSRFTPSTWQTRDDLTQISGIGPVIQRKLNELEIYSFQQISEFTPEMIERVTKTIKFFPDRIGRDNWIGQAAALMRRK